MPLKYEVWRRFNDFFWLRKILVREYPGYYIPPLPRKGKSRKFNKDHIAERMIGLNQFMEVIGYSKELKSSIYVHKFLKCKDSKLFAKLRKNLTKNTSMISVKEFIPLLIFVRILLGR